jgi:hypothetical protein
VGAYSLVFLENIDKIPPERKVRMVWLRRAIGVIFATAIAIGAGLVFLPVAALADPVTRAAGFSLIQFAVWALADADILRAAPSGQALRQVQERGPIGFYFTITGGCTRRWDISARWPSRKNGLPINKGAPHHRSAKGDPIRRHRHYATEASVPKSGGRLKWHRLHDGFFDPSKA